MCVCVCVHTKSFRSYCADERCNGRSFHHPLTHTRCYNTSATTAVPSLSTYVHIHTCAYACAQHVCVCVLAYVCVGVCTHLKQTANVRVHTHVSLFGDHCAVQRNVVLAAQHTHTCACIRVCICTYTRAVLRVRTNIRRVILCARVCMCVHQITSLCMYLCVYVCVHTLGTRCQQRRRCQSTDSQSTTLRHSPPARAQSHSVHTVKHTHTHTCTRAVHWYAVVETGAHTHTHTHKQTHMHTCMSEVCTCVYVCRHTRVHTMVPTRQE